MRQLIVAIACGYVGLLSAAPCSAQPFGPQPPAFESIEVSAENAITFRIHAPEAEDVQLFSMDLPGVVFGGAAMTKGDEEIWSVTLESVPSGAYRYLFRVDGLMVIVPRNPATSESNANARSLVHVPGSEVSDVKDVPHGAIAEVTYRSQALDRFRRMHVYTPPGYEKDDRSYPVLYLLHGAIDSDDSWSTIGRAGVILDNLIATGQARAMIVVMPNGHTGPFQFGPGSDLERQITEFGADFVGDIRPYVESHYRVVADREHRAIAGLSMGGQQTLNIAFDQLQDYGYIGVFSSGVFGIAGGFGGGPRNEDWEESRQATLDDAELKQGLCLVWFGCGDDDFLLSTSNSTIAMLRSHGFEVVDHQTGGGHTWSNWRDYLSEFAPQLFIAEQP
jgi:enterochelin esterase family protein